MPRLRSARHALRMGATIVVLVGCSGGRSQMVPQGLPLGIPQLMRPQAPVAGTFTTIDDPNGDHFTFATGINARHDMVGFYLDGGHFHGFFLHDKKFTRFDDPSEGHGPPGPLGPQGVHVDSISPSGVIGGLSIDGNNVAHAFELRNGRYRDYDEPNAGHEPGQGSGPNNTDDHGNAVGTFIDGNFAWHGFIKRGSKYTTIDDPDNAPDGQQQAVDVDRRGTIVGLYYTSDNVAHGYLLRKGHFTTLDDPAGPLGTAPFSFSPLGGIAGEYFDAKNVQHGFLLCNGTFTTFDDPLGGHRNGQGSQVYRIASDGKAVGEYYASKNLNHTDSYLYRPHGRVRERECSEGGG